MRTYLLAVALSVAASPTFANPLMYEGFNYTVGDRIIGKTTPDGTSWSDPTMPSQPGPGAPAGFSQTDPQVIVAGSIGYPGLASPTGEHFVVPRGVIGGAGGTTQSNIARLLIPGAPLNASTVGNGTTGSLFFSLTMQLTNFATAPAGTGTGQAGNVLQQAGSFVAGFHATDPAHEVHMGAAATAAAYGGVLRIRREVAGDGITGTGNYEFGIAKSWTGTGVTTTWDTAGSFAPGNTVFLVGEYQFVNAPTIGTDDVFRLWINPTPGAPMGAPSLIATGGPDVNSDSPAAQVIRSFFFRSETVTPGDLQFDELRIGTAYGDVVSSVPEASPIALGAVTCICGALLTWFSNRSRTPATQRIAG